MTHPHPYIEETMMQAIKDEFRIERIQYACVGQETTETNGLHHLHIQIILKQKGNKRHWFLDQVTGQCPSID